MHIVHHAHLRGAQLGGEHRLVAAGRAQGLTAFEVWLSTVPPGAATNEWCHHGELVALAQQGAGKLLVDGAPLRFQAPCSLPIPPGCRFSVANNGGAALQLVWVGTRPPEPADAPSTPLPNHP